MDPASQLTTLQDTLGTLISKDGLVLLGSSPRTPGFYSPIFLVAKKDSKNVHMIFKMKLFKAQFQEKQAHFRMTSVVVQGEAMVH